MCPAVSRLQQRLMGMVHAYQKGELKLADLPNQALRDKIKSMAKSLTDTDAEKFAKTKHKGLPIKVKETEMDEAKNSRYKLYGKSYKTKTFDSDKRANQFMAKTKGWGVIGVDGNTVHVARVDDKGKPIDESKVNEKFPADWQLDPKQIDNPTVQLWLRSGTMITAQLPKKDAQKLVKAKKAYVITGQAIGMFENIKAEEKKINEDKQSEYKDKIKNILLKKFQNTKKVQELMDKYSLYVYDMFKDQPPETVAKNILSNKVPKNYLKEQMEKSKTNKIKSIIREVVREIIINRK